MTAAQIEALSWQRDDASTLVLRDRWGMELAVVRHYGSLGNWKPEWASAGKSGRADTVREAQEAAEAALLEVP